MAHGREPKYEGHRLSEWITPLSCLNTTTPGFDWTPDGATQAVLHADTTSLHHLLCWITYRPPNKLKQLTWSVINKLPPMRRPKSLVNWIYYDPGEARADAAARAFYILGQRAAPAINELVKAASTPGLGQEPQCRAAYALACIGLPALPALITVANNPSAGGRLYAIRCMGYLGTNGLPAVPFLLVRLNCTNEMVAMEAAAALGELHLEPGRVVPALVEATQRNQETLRIWAMGALGDFGPQAREAVPALLDSLRGSDWSVKQYAAEALKKVAPDTLTNPSDL